MINGKQESTKTTHDTKRPNHGLRRVVAIGALGLASFGVTNIVSHAHERYTGTDIPDAKSAHEHPEEYDTYLVQPGDTPTGIAEQFTPDNHDYRNNVVKILDQVKADGYEELTAGDKISVPTTHPK